MCGRRFQSLGREGWGRWYFWYGSLRFTTVNLSTHTAAVEVDERVNRGVPLDRTRSAPARDPISANLAVLIAWSPRGTPPPRSTRCPSVARPGERSGLAPRPGLSGPAARAS